MLPGIIRHPSIEIKNILLHHGKFPMVPELLFYAAKSLAFPP